MIKTILVLGAGSAGLLAAISVKRKLPGVEVRIVRSPEIGTIGVGEGTTPNFPQYLFDDLGIDRAAFYKRAEPTWKIGIRLLWGPRPHFDYHFAKRLDAQWSDLTRSHGYYCDEDFTSTDLISALMEQGRAFPRQSKYAVPNIQPWHGFHIENKKLIEALEIVVQEVGVEIIDGTVDGVDRGPQGVAGLHLQGGRRLEADLYIDASGFRCELLGKALEEPYISFDKALFCDRAVVGGWDRTTEPILPYTIAETMDAGWAWQIEHEHHVNRGYVYSSQAISDDEAAAEFRRKNPKTPGSPRVVKFRSGRRRRQWVDNVVAIGNSSGFVEPLEATALAMVCEECHALRQMLHDSGCAPTATMRDLYNVQIGGSWDEIRDFLALHYKLNTRLDTPFWKHCRADTDLGQVEPLLKFYEENGPSAMSRSLMVRDPGNFGIEGYLAMMVGNRHPYRARYEAPAQERQAWSSRQADFVSKARQGFDVRQTLAFVRDPRWVWHKAPAPGVPVTTGPDAARRHLASFALG